jgi:hypothetical protein
MQIKRWCPDEKKAPADTFWKEDLSIDTIWDPC